MSFEYSQKKYENGIHTTTLDCHKGTVLKDYPDHNYSNYIVSVFHKSQKEEKERKKEVNIIIVLCFSVSCIPVLKLKTTSYQN